jgi:hypothetical protein
MNLEEIQTAAVAEGLANQDGSDITTEEQLKAARELAANPPEETDEEKATRLAKESQAEEDPLLAVMLETTEGRLRAGFESQVQPAPEPTEREKNLATLKEWGVVLPETATDEEVAAKVSEGKPAATAAPAAQPAPAKPAKKPKFTVVPKEAQELVKAPEAEPMAQPAQPVIVPDADEDYIKTLTEDQQDELEEARVAEMLEPVRCKDQRKKLIAFYRRFDAEAPRIQSESPDRPLEDNEQFRALVKSKPTLEPVVVKRVNREIGAREGERRTQAKLNPEMEEIKMNQRRIDMAPKFETFIKDHFRTGALSQIVSDTKSPAHEALKLLHEKGEAESEKEFKMETRIWKQEIGAMEGRVRKFLLFTNSAIKHDPAKPDEDLTWVSNFVEEEGRKMAQYEATQVRMRKSTVFDLTFLPRMEFIRMLNTNQEEAKTYDRKTFRTAKYCTFTDNDILSFMATKVKMIVEERINNGLKTAEDLGFKREKPNKSTPAANGAHKPPTEVQPPRTVVSPARGASRTPVNTPAKNDDPIDVTANLPPVYDHLKIRR